MGEATMRRESFEGSATVEMAYIMPLFLSLFLLTVTAIFYFHDKSVLYATAYETALAGAQAEREGEGSDEELSAFFQKRIKDNQPAYLCYCVHFEHPLLP